MTGACGKHHRGVASVVAILALGLLGVAALSLTSMFRLDVRRTHDLRDETQLTQLLRAGADAAHERLNAPDHNMPPDESWDVPLPGALADSATLTVTLTPDEKAPDTRAAIITATLGDAEAEQRVVWQRDGNAGWAVTSAELYRTH